MTTLSPDDIFSKYPDEILIERKPHGVLLITINRPENLNALTMPMFEAMADMRAPLGHGHPLERVEERRIR